MVNNMNLIAICCCGNLSIEIQGNPIVNAVCHCNDCKRRTGSAFGMSVYVKDEQIVCKQGETRVYKVNSDVQQERYFCNYCGTTLYWKVSNFPDLTGIAGGCFAESEILKPDYTVSNDNICTWVNFPGELKNTITPDDFL